MTAVDGASRGCPVHGTHSTASVDDMYRRSVARKRKRRELLYAQGLTLMVDAGPAAEHMRGLIAAGATRSGIARESWCSRSMIRSVLDGGRTRIHRDTEARILRVQWCPGVADTHGMPAVGTRRRLQGLVAMGHGTPRLVAECGLSKSLINDHLAGRLALVRAETAARVGAAARRLITVPGDDPAAVRRALRHGWAPLAAWDDIDDPKARPYLGGSPLGSRRRGIVEDTAELIARGASREEISARLGLEWNSVLTAHARCGVSLMGVIS